MQDVDGRAGSVSSGEPSSDSTSDAYGPDDLAVRMSGSARDLQQQETADDTSQAVVAAAIELVPGAQEGSISVVERRRKVRSEAAPSTSRATSTSCRRSWARARA